VNAHYLEKAIEIPVNHNSTIEQLKNALMENLHIPTDHQILLHKKFDVFALEHTQVMESGCLTKYGLTRGKYRNNINFVVLGLHYNPLSGGSIY